MMDGKTIRKKLVGNEQDRAVSPVIGVILMVAITVILAAVIAAFVLDMGQGQSQSATAGIDMSEDSDGDIEVTINSVEQADTLRFEGCSGIESGSAGDLTTVDGSPGFDNPSAGNSGTLDCSSSSDATVQAIGSYDGSENVITTYEK